MEINFNSEGDYAIKEEAKVKLTEYKKRAKIVETSNIVNALKGYKKLNSEEYYDEIEKKVKKYKVRAYRTRSGLNNSMNKVRNYLINNFFGEENELFVTLTYKQQMQNMEQLKKDYDYFWKRLKRQYQDLEYLYVVELQEDRNSLHLHILLKDIKHKELYIPHGEITRLWNKGHVWVSKINMRDTIGILSDYTIKERTAIGRVIKYMTKIETKLKVPRNKNIYSKSKGIIAPKIKKMTFKEAKEIVNQNEYKFSHGYSGELRTWKHGYIIGEIKGQIYTRIK